MLKTFAFFLMLALSATMMSGCKTDDPAVVEASDFSRLSSISSVSRSAELSPGDSIEISVEVDGIIEVPSQRVKVNYLGDVTLPLVGDVQVSGMNMDVARVAITKKYEAYYVNTPVIMISRVNSEGTASEWGQVTVLGRVNHPGAVMLTSGSGINLSAAIQAAGGFATSAKTSDVRVSRVDARGRKLKVNVDFDQIGQEGNADADLKLMDGDIVYVPERIF